MLIMNDMETHSNPTPATTLKALNLNRGIKYHSPRKRMAVVHEGMSQQAKEILFKERRAPSAKDQPVIR